MTLQYPLAGYKYTIQRTKRGQGDNVLANTDQS